jgi:SAM-dependent methyltransferase
MAGTMSDMAGTDAIAYYSGAARQFHDSYRQDANRLERLRVWSGYLDRFIEGHGFGYDLGCGSGILACELARRGQQVIGIDGAAGMLAIAGATAREAGLERVSFQQHRLPIADVSAFRPGDFVVSSSALEYLDSMPVALRSVHGMLRPGGTLIFSVSNYDSLSRKAVRLVHGLTGRPVYFGLLKQFMTAESIRACLYATGFSYVEHRYFAKADRLNRCLGAVLPEQFASNMIIAVARRN